MKKRIIVTLLMVACMVLGGCGSSADSGTTSSSPAAYAEEGAVSTAPVEDTSSERLEEQTVADDFGQVPEDDTVPWDETAEDEQSFEAEITTQDDAVNEVKGIVVVNSYFTAVDGNGRNYYYEVSAVEPADGSVTHIATFSFYQPNYHSGEIVSFLCEPIIGPYSHVGYDQRLFSDDFTKMAITLGNTERYEYHAGWIDQSGDFFDVTEALGEAPGDFGEVIPYAAVGFTEDGKFVYNNSADIPGMRWDASTAAFWYTDALNPTGSCEGNPLSSYCPIYQGFSGHACISDSNGTTNIITYLNDKTTKSAKYDITTGEVTQYIPESQRENWSGVISPDGSQIAFLSMPKNGNGTPEIYIVPFDGGDPVKIDCDLGLSAQQNLSPCTLLYWK